ncbi:hypothetical protein ABFG93_13595 [Pseudalkalibacillus hwajinpoensis]|uniref:hypothetical protein n=1 Tax=Guptibacillus hwajinpoensis TaxID=208199 RepID=UPI00325AD24B
MKLLKGSTLISLGAFILLILLDYFSNKGLNLLDNAFQAVLLGVFFAFITWAFDSKDYKKKKKNFDQP